MASKRLAQTAVDWATFGTKMPDAHKEFFKALKARTDSTLFRITSNPDKLPAINFEQYRKTVSDKAMIDAFEKQYKALSIAYPTDVEKKVEKLTQEEAVVAEKVKQGVAKVNADIEFYKNLLAWFDKLPAPEEMNHELMAAYFPSGVPNPEKPTHWPHTWYFNGGGAELGKRIVNH